MKYANPKNAKVGDKVLVPINGEFMQDEQICQEYEVVLALKCKTPQEKQIVATCEPPMPMLLEFTDQVGYEFKN